MEGVHSNFKTTTQHVNFVHILQVLLCILWSRREVINCKNNPTCQFSARVQPFALYGRGGLIFKNNSTCQLSP